MARALKFWEKVDGALEGPKSGRGYEPHEFVQPMVWMLHAGWRRLEDLRELRAEREVLERLGLEVVPECWDSGRLVTAGRSRGARAGEPGTGCGMPEGRTRGVDAGCGCDGD